MINVYLDDIRSCPIGYVLARTYEECIELIKNNDINILSLDHDLGGVKTGYDVTKFIVENNLYPKIIYLHTANPVGRANMYQLLNAYKPSTTRIY